MGCKSDDVFQISPEVLRALREELGSKAVLAAEVDDEPSVLPEEETGGAPSRVKLNVPVS